MGTEAEAFVVGATLALLGGLPGGNSFFCMPEGAGLDLAGDLLERAPGKKFNTVGFNVEAVVLSTPCFQGPSAGHQSMASAST